MQCSLFLSFRILEINEVNSNVSSTALMTLPNAMTHHSDQRMTFKCFKITYIIGISFYFQPREKRLTKGGELSEASKLFLN